MSGVSNASSKGSSAVSDDAVNIYPGNTSMRFCTFWSALTSTKTRMTTVTAIAVTSRQFSRRRLTRPAKDAAKKVDTKADSAKKGEAHRPCPKNWAF